MSLIVAFFTVLELELIFAPQQSTVCTVLPTAVLPPRAELELVAQGFLNVSKLLGKSADQQAVNEHGPYIGFSNFMYGMCAMPSLAAASAGNLTYKYLYCSLPWRNAVCASATSIGQSSVATCHRLLGPHESVVSMSVLTVRCGVFSPRVSL